MLGTPVQSVALSKEDLLSLTRRPKARRSGAPDGAAVLVDDPAVAASLAELLEACLSTPGANPKQNLLALIEVSHEALQALGAPQLRALLAGASKQARWYERLVETLEEAPGGHISEPAILLQARRLAEARRQLLVEHGALRSHEVAELAGSGAANASSRASDWRRRGRIFAVEHQGQTLFPAFQFGLDGRPRPILAKVLAVLAEHLDPWQMALWFTTSQESLGGSRPVDRLDDDPEAVLRAARAETEPLDY